MTTETKPPRKPAGRPRQFTEADVLRSAMDVFWAHGFEGTSIRDLETATGLQKGSLYAAFENKAALYLRALGQYEADVVDAGCEMLRTHPDPREALFLLFNGPIAAVESGDLRGCFLCNASADRAEHDVPTARLVARGYAKLTDALADTVSRWRPDADARRTAHHLLATYTGLRVLSRSGIGLDVLRDARDAALAG